MIRVLFNTFIENRILNRWIILLFDMCLICLATVISYYLTLEVYHHITDITHINIGIYLGITLIVNLASFLFFKTYKGIVRYSTLYEFQRMFISLAVSNIIIFLILFFGFGHSLTVTLAYCAALFLISYLNLYGFRNLVIFSYKKLQEQYSQNKSISVFLWGLNEDNIILAQLLNSGNGKFKIKGFLDKDKENNKLSKQSNLPVISITSTKAFQKYKVKGILFGSEEEVKRDTGYIQALIEKDIAVYVTQQLNIDNLSQLSDIISHIRPIQIEDLLGRSEINISMDSIAKNVKGKTVLVTGAAGSIGSEIVRQLATFYPKNIICLDQAETPLNELFLELGKKFPLLQYTTIIGDVKNKHKLSLVFAKHKPDIIYHAAAYKHVPIMENDPCEAIRTNVEGTINTVDLAIEHGAEMFVMISTDKAVNPTNIMGTSKRLAEIYVQSCANNPLKNTSKTKFVTTRFGNVLGSNGSVIPLFRRQIQNGGPITVTHPEITRYFMTIPEACRLVLEASVIGLSGYIYVFDMGEPVKIYDLAKRMIELAGLTPGVDIKIEFSGLRPGEKLYEELLNDSELTESTSHQKIMIAKVRNYELDQILPEFAKLLEFAHNEETMKTVKQMKCLVPEFISKNSVYEELDQQNIDITVSSPREDLAKANSLSQGL